VAEDDLVCPDCGGPIGMTATYCMHCSADLTEQREAADANDDGVWDGAEVAEYGEPDPPAGSAAADSSTSGLSPAGSRSTGTDARASTPADEQLLHPDGFVDNALTVVVGILAGIVVGLVGTVVLTILTGSALGLLFGFVAWLGSTAYLVRRRTVQGAIAHGAYAVAVVFLLVPFVAVSPFVSVDGGVVGRLQGFLVLLLFMAVPAGIAGAVGFVASRFVPAGERRGIEL